MTQIYDETGTVYEDIVEPIEIEASFNIPEEIIIPVAVPKKKKGRPVVHGFAGRITLLRDEVVLALNDGPAFIELMRQGHELPEDIINQLYTDGEISAEYTDLFFTYQGNIEVVLSELAAAMRRWEARATAMRVDFKKKKINNDPPDRDAAGVVHQIEAYPDKIYGYLRITYKNEPENLGAVYNVEGVK